MARPSSGPDRPRHRRTRAEKGISAWMDAGLHHEDSVGWMRRAGQARFTRAGRPDGSGWPWRPARAQRERRRYLSKLRVEVGVRNQAGLGPLLPDTEDNRCRHRPPSRAQAVRRMAPKVSRSCSRMCPIGYRTPRAGAERTSSRRRRPSMASPGVRGPCSSASHWPATFSALSFTVGRDPSVVEGPRGPSSFLVSTTTRYASEPMGSFGWAVLISPPGVERLCSPPVVDQRNAR